MADPEGQVVYCPRCDRGYADKTKPLAMRKMVKHVQEAHPDYYDPDMFDES